MRDDERSRYSRHILLPEIGEAGQEKLRRARVLVVGAGGLGSASILYLTAAGVGTIGIADGDRVELSNLQRQILHETGDIGRPKAESARDAVLDLNPEVAVYCHPRIDPSNAASIISEYDIVADGSDNFATRFLVHDTCFRLEKPLVSSAIIGFTGYVSTFKAYLGPPHPCYRCFHPEMDPGMAGAPTCAEAGVFGPLAGMAGSWQAAEILKELLGTGRSLSGALLHIDAYQGTVRKTALSRDPACKGCGTSHDTVTQGYEKTEEKK